MRQQSNRRGNSSGLHASLSQAPLEDAETTDAKLAYETRSMRRLANALPAPGALTLLGAPLLAVVATFWLQPRANGFEQPQNLGSGPNLVTHVDGETRPDSPSPGSAEAAPTPSEVLETQEPFESIARALDAGELDRAKTLLQKLDALSMDAVANPDISDDRLAQLIPMRDAYRLVVDCLENPSNDTTARALHFYLQEAVPDAARPRLYRACLSEPRHHLP